MITNLVRRGRGRRRAVALGAIAVLVGSVLLVGGSVLTASAAAPVDTSALSPTTNNAPNQWTNPGNALDGDGTNYATATRDQSQGYAGSACRPSPTARSSPDQVTAVAKATDADCRARRGRLTWNNGASTTAGHGRRPSGRVTRPSRSAGFPRSGRARQRREHVRAGLVAERAHERELPRGRGPDDGPAAAGAEQRVPTSLKSLTVASLSPRRAGTANTAITPAPLRPGGLRLRRGQSGSSAPANLATMQDAAAVLREHVPDGRRRAVLADPFSVRRLHPHAGFVDPAAFKTAASNGPASSGHT